jgi:hypothetical protein
MFIHRPRPGLSAGTSASALPGTVYTVGEIDVVKFESIHFGHIMASWYLDLCDCCWLSSLCGCSQPFYRRVFLPNSVPQPRDLCARGAILGP